jgi:hypothetical protein
MYREKQKQPEFENFVLPLEASSAATGSDIPYLTSDTFEKAFEILDTRGCVLGPAQDGGYYLIGLRHATFREEAFEQVEWSTSEVLHQTVSRLNERDCDYRQLPRFRDMDRLDDVRDYFLFHESSGESKSRSIDFIECHLKRYFEARDLIRAANEQHEQNMIHKSDRYKRRHTVSAIMTNRFAPSLELNQKMRLKHYGKV